MKLQISNAQLPTPDGTTESVIPIIRTIIGSALSIVELSQDGLERVVITNRDGFGPAVHRLQEDAGQPLSYTDNDIHQAAAKTIARHEGDRIVSSIILSDFIVARVMEAAQKSYELDEWDHNGQFCFYIVAHEVGHCKDHILRPDDEETSLQTDGVFSIRQIAKYYQSILMGEFAACVHSAGAVTDGVHKAHVEAWRTDSQSLLDQVKKHMREYQADHSRLRFLAFSASQAFWVIILQYAKLIGSSIGNEDLDPTQPSWITDDKEIEDVLKQVRSVLIDMWSEYPAWPGALVEKLFDLWKRLALTHGYRFVEELTSDGLFLDREKV